MYYFFLWALFIFILVHTHGEGYREEMVQACSTAGGTLVKTPEDWQCMDESAVIPLEIE